MSTGRLIVVVVVIAGLVLAGAVQYARSQVLPAMTLTTIDGKPFDTHRLRGAPALVTFWATTCAPCIEELPDLIALHREFAPRGFTLLAVVARGDKPADVAAVAKSKAIPYAIAFDPDGRLAQALDVRVIPRSFLVDAQGRLIMKHTGAVEIQPLRARIASLLENQ